MGWPNISVSIHPDQMEQIPTILRAISPAQIWAMQDALHCARRLLWFSSMYGACRAELGTPGPDAFDALMGVLARRLPGYDRQQTDRIDFTDTECRRRLHSLANPRPRARAG